MLSPSSRKEFIGESYDLLTETIADANTIEGNRVRLGLDAPKEIAILREEVHHRYTTEASNDPHHPDSDCDEKLA